MTPKKARSILERHNSSNRSLSPRRVRELVESINATGWHITSQGIGFYEDGELADGQHRLKAMTYFDEDSFFYVPVTTNITRSAGIAIDKGRSRTYKDSQKIMGKEVRTQTKAIILLALRVSRLCDAKTAVYHENHKDDLDFAARLASPGVRYITNRFYLFAFYSALLHGEDRAKLLELSDKFKAGTIKSKAAQSLRTKMLQTKARHLDQMEIICARLKDMIWTWCNRPGEFESRSVFRGKVKGIRYEVSAGEARKENSQ